MRVVVDTNVLMSGLFFAGVPGRVLDALKDGRLTLVASPGIVDEYVRVANDLESKLGDVGSDSVLTFLVTRAEVVDAAELPERVCCDPDDDKYLAAARAASVAVIISGDRDLQTLGRWQDIQIMSPRTFADSYLSGGGT